MANLVHDERVKLRATLFNTAAGACIALGVLAPIVAAFYGLGTRPPLFGLGSPPLARSTQPPCGPCGDCEMTDPYTIAFLVVPLLLAAHGWAYELMAERGESRLQP